jgi:hypothetical protein
MRFSTISSASVYSVYQKDEGNRQSALKISGNKTTAHRQRRAVLTRELKRLMLDNLSPVRASQGLGAGEYLIKDK